MARPEALLLPVRSGQEVGWGTPGSGARWEILLPHGWHFTGGEHSMYARGKREAVDYLLDVERCTWVDGECPGCGELEGASWSPDEWDLERGQLIPFGTDDGEGEGHV